MKRTIYPLLGGLFLAATAHAEMIQGSITYVDSTNHMISIRPTDESKEGSSQLIVKVKDDTKTQNLASADELRVGQQVKVDAKQNKADNLLEAKSIEVTTDSSSAPSSPASAGSQGGY